MDRRYSLFFGPVSIGDHLRTFLSIWLFIALPCIAQGQLVDSISRFLSHEPSIMAKFDSRHSFITAQHAKIFGVKVGLDHQDRVQYGLGVNWLLPDDDLDQRLRVSRVDASDTTVMGSIDMFFVSPFFEYTFYHTPHWEISVPVQVGIGRSALRYTDDRDDRRIVRNGGIFTYEPAMTVQYKFWRYFGVGVGVGYRLMLIDNSEVEEEFTSPLYMFRTKIFFGRLYEDFVAPEDRP